jgi:hypothetical protein
MNQVSAKTRDRNEYYRLLRAVWLPERTCEKGCLAQATDVHHSMGRGKSFMLDVATYKALCRRCHQHVTDHPTEAYELGLTLHTWEDPPIMPATAVCRSCFAPIYWVKSGDTSMPLVADPDSGEPKDFSEDAANRMITRGRIQETWREASLLGSSSEIHVRVLTADETPNPALPVWRSHFWDCPQAHQWRSKQ